MRGANVWPAPEEPLAGGQPPAALADGARQMLTDLRAVVKLPIDQHEAKLVELDEQLEALRSSVVDTLFSLPWSSGRYWMASARQRRSSCLWWSPRMASFALGQFSCRSDWSSNTARACGLKASARMVRRTIS